MNKEPDFSLAVAAETATDLHYLLRLMHWGGTMPHPRADKLGIVMFSLRKAALLVLCCCVICSEIAYLWKEGLSDFKHCTLTLSCINSQIAWLMRLTHLTVRCHDFHKLSQQVRQDFSEYLTWRDVPILQDMNAKLRRFLKVFLCFGTVASLMWMCDTQSLQYDVALPYDVTRPFAFTVTWILCALFSFSNCTLCIVADLLYVSLITQLRMQMILLGRNIVELSSEAEYKDKIAVKKEYIPSVNESGWISCVHERLRKVIQHNQTIIRNAELLEKSLSGVLLGQSVSIGISISILLFQLSMTTNDLNYAVKCSFFLLAMLGEIFLYCWFGDALISENENVTFAAYDALTSLQSCPMSIKRSLLLLMVRSQRPLRITAAGMFDLSRESLISILNVSYSYFTLLRQFREEED